MGEIEKSKTPFEDFIASMDKMNGIEGKLIVISSAASIAEQLVKSYGLPEDPECITIINEAEQKWKMLHEHQFPAMLLAYIKILCWQCAIENPQPLNACIESFLWGMAIGQIIDLEEP